MPKRATVLRWIAVLYLAQGLPYGITSKVWPVYFRTHGVSLAAIGALGLVALPWSWKPLWAPLVDRFAERRVWVTSGLVAIAVACALFPWIDPSPVTSTLVAAMLLLTVASATQDIAIDAWAIDVATPETIGPINGTRAGAFRVGMLVAGGVAVILADWLPWTVVWALLAGVFLALAATTALLPSGDPERIATRWRSREIADWLLRREMIPVVAFLPLFKVGDGALTRMVEPFWVDRGMRLTEIGLVSNTLGVVATIAGAIAGGWCVARWGLFRALFVLGLGQVASNLVYAAAAAVPVSRLAMYSAALFESVTQGLGTAAFLAFLTVACGRDQPATRFALLSAIVSLSRELAGALSGIGAERFGYAGFFALTAAAALPALLLLPTLRPMLERASTAGTPRPAEALG